MSLKQTTLSQLNLMLTSIIYLQFWCYSPSSSVFNWKKYIRDSHIQTEWMNSLVKTLNEMSDVTVNPTMNVVTCSYSIQ